MGFRQPFLPERKGRGGGGRGEVHDYAFFPIRYSSHAKILSGAVWVSGSSALACKVASTKSTLEVVTKERMIWACSFCFRFPYVSLTLDVSSVVFPFFLTEARDNLFNVKYVKEGTGMSLTVVSE